MEDLPTQAARARREPPAFRPVHVQHITDVTPRLRRLTLGGPALEGLPSGLPAASVRVLLPRGGADELPRWQGNEFRWPDGSRPTIRTLTPRRAATEGPSPELDVEVVLHGTGALSSWAAAVGGGEPVAVAGTGRGYEIDPEATELILAGDETALAALGVLLEALPPAVTARVIVEAADPAARFELPEQPGAHVEWHVLSPGAAPGSALLETIRAMEVDPAARWWVAGEAAGVQRIRRHLFDDRQVPRERTVVRGYWKHGRAAAGDG